MPLEAWLLWLMDLEVLYHISPVTEALQVNTWKK